MSKDNKVAEKDEGTSSSSLLKMSEEVIPRFNGTDKGLTVSNWASEVEDNATIYGWTPLQKLLIARRSLEGTAALWLRTEKAFKSYEDLKTALEKEFPDTATAKDIHDLLSSRKKKKSETCYEYMLAMKEIGKRGKLADYVTIQYIIEGIIDNEQNKMMLYGANSYVKLKEQLKLYEQLKCNMAKSEKKVQHSPMTPKQQVQPVKNCYNCGAKNHIANACPDKMKGLKCFKCNNFGHKATECTDSGELRDVNNRSAHTRSQVERARDLSLIEDTTASQCQTFCAVKTISLGDSEIPCLVDTGSELNLITSDFVIKSGIVSWENCSICVSGLGQNTVKTLGKLFMSVKIDDKPFHTVFHIMPSGTIPHDVIIGQELMSKATILINNGQITFLNDLTTDDDSWEGKFLCGFADVNVDSYRQEVDQLIQNYVPKKTMEAPIKLKIILKDDIPVVHRPRRLSEKEREEVRRQISEWLKEGIVRPSFSEYCSPLVLVRKKDQSTRICVDYRKINQKMIKDEFPLPVIEDHLDRLCKAKVFSTLDLKNGFFHLAVEEDSVKYTAFVTEDDQYEFLKAPFGLSNCPKYFMRFVTMIYRDLIRDGKVLIFIDDLIVPGVNEEEAMLRLKEVLQVASAYGLEINWKKCHLMCTRVEYLGHIIENGTVRPSSDKTDAVMKFPEPQSIKQVQSFIGLTSYFRKFIQNYSLIAKPLTDMLRKGVEFQFEEDQRQAFAKLKTALCNDPVLKIYNPELETQMHTDASIDGYSAILMQRSGEDGQFHPVHFMSRKTTDAERRYSSYELESLAIVEGVKKFRKYLFGIKFKIVTDCSAFEMTLKKKDLCTRIARWVLILQDYDYTVEHRAGEKMKHTDSLSRNPYAMFAKTELHYKIQRAQQLDDGLRAIAEVLKDGRFEDYYMENGLLYRGQRKLIIPKGLENEIIRRGHGYGHFGIEKTEELLEENYFNKDLKSKVEKFIANCVPCILASRKEGKQEGFLNPIVKESVPLHTMHIDHIGPLAETKKKYNYILTLVDAFTKFTWIFPVKTVTARETLDKLLIFQQMFGNPTRIISDRGAAFTSKEFTDFCKEEEIEHYKITTGVPRGNGQVERIHRTIIAVLTKLCLEDPTQWYKHTSKLQRALNSTYQRSVNTTPCELLIGVKMKQKEDLDLIRLLEEEKRQNFIEDRNDRREDARQQILKIQDENRKSYNKKRKISRKYAEGELVAIKRTQFGTAMKLKAKYLGPYKVVSVTRNDRYKVEKLSDSSEGPKVTYSSADYMKPWRRTDSDYDTTDNDISDDDDDKEK